MPPVQTETELIRNLPVVTLEAKQTQLSQLLGLPVEDLYARIGTFTETTRVRPTDGRELIEYGRQWLSRWLQHNQDELRLAICIRGRYCEKLLQQKLKDKTVIAGLVLDALVTQFTAIPAFSITVLLVNLGLEGFCRCDQDKPSGEADQEELLSVGDAANVNSNATKSAYPSGTAGICDSPEKTRCR